MPLPPAAERTHIHTRQVECKGYRRTDGLWDIEGHITDRKTYDFSSEARGEVKAGVPVHEMWLRLTVDETFTVKAVEAVTDYSPYPATCPHIAPDYSKIVGLRIGAGWTKAVKERMGGVQGCTHLTELLGPVATTAFQTIYPIITREAQEKRRAAGDTAPPGKFPLLNTCHAFRADGEVIEKYLPAFYNGKTES